MLVCGLRARRRAPQRRRLTVALDPRVRQFHDRPFQVLDAYRFADALMDTITDPQIKALPRVGAIDQYVDSSDMTDREAAQIRRHYINGPAQGIKR